MKLTTLLKRSVVLITVGLSTLLAISVRADKVVTPKAGAPGDWRLIGTTHADHSADHDALIVKGPFDNFRRIKFKVTDAPLQIRRLVVTYDNGVPDKLEVREDIAKGGESRAIDLRGVGKRSIRKIEFWYETKGFLNGKADVTVFGMK
jgi:hypothetical protein